MFDRVVEEKYNGTVKYRYVYNGEGDLAKKIEVQRSGLSEKEVNVVNYEYDSLDRLIHSSEERIEDGKTTEVQRSEHIYDGENRITKQSWSVGGEAGRSENYTYSTTDGTLQSMKTANGETISFEYDALKRLKNIKSKHGSGTDFITQTYTYKDRAGQTTDGKPKKKSDVARMAVSIGVDVGMSKFVSSIPGHPIHKVSRSESRFKLKAPKKSSTISKGSKKAIRTAIGKSKSSLKGIVKSCKVQLKKSHRRIKWEHYLYNTHVTYCINTILSKGKSNIWNWWKKRKKR